jgi:hypothetical protein
MKKYIVCYMTETDNGYLDHYAVFQDENSDINYKNAKIFYENRIKDETIYSVNLTEIIKSSDY